MKNTVIWGFEKEIARYAIQSLEREKWIVIKAWFGQKEKSKVVTHNCYDIHKENSKRDTFLYCDEKIYNEIYKHLYVFIDMQSRKFPLQDKSLHEYLNLFNLLLNLFYEILKKDNIELVMFANIPHEGPEYILYLLAKAMKIKTIIVTQSLFPDRFFYVHDVDDLGTFAGMAEYQSLSEQIKLERIHEKDLFYMTDTVAENKVRKNFSTWKQERIAVWQKSRKKYVGLLDCFGQHLYKKIVKHHLSNSYKRRIETYFQHEVDLSAKFVYFPLHMQPEMTTSGLGGIYCDQLLAIERLSALIPEDWTIYVKENPKQTSFMRGKYFFARLKNIAKVKNVVAQFNTYDLIKNSQFVATITGTAGWEAISGGKNAVVFGRAWYNALPGVFQYSKDLQLEDIINYQIDHNDLKSQLSSLLRETAIGVVDVDYAELVSNFNIQDNNRKLEAFFKGILSNNQ